MEFKPRLTAPALTDKNYYSDKNIFTASGYGMEKGNCTAYVEGRCMEAWGKPSGCLHSAGLWIEDAKKKKLEISDKPVLGAIAVWKIPNTEKDGHVAFVEKILANADIFTSNSAWKGTVFYTQTFKAGFKYAWTSNITGKKYELIGFILPPKPFEEPAKKLITTASVQFRRDPENPKDRLGSVPRGSVFMYDGHYKVVKNAKWLRGVYNSELGWISGLFAREAI